MREPTMADIAARLGVSRQLVSIALRGLPGASSETRERVRKVAEELGYRPHLAARSLRQTKSRHTGIAFAPVSAPEADLVEAIYPVAAEHGYQLVLSARTGTRSTRQAVDELLGYRCAAVIVIGSGLPDAELRELADQVPVPMVALGASQRSPAFDVVRSAGDVGIALAVDHLIGLGHQRIAYVHCGAMPVAAIRMRGYIWAASAAGFEADVVSVPGPDYTEEAGAAAGRILLGRDELPTAVVTGHDQQAAGLLQVLSRAGVAVPGRISLTGFGDGWPARLSSVDLTTARQDHDVCLAALIAGSRYPQTAAYRTIGRTGRGITPSGRSHSAVAEGLMSGRRGAPDGAGADRSYGELYVEHAPAARGLALSMVPPDVADDIVAEAFARVLAAIRAGGGPDHAFRPYLLAAVRNLANDWIAARRRVTVIGDLDEGAGDRSAVLTSGFSGDAETEAEARAEARLIVRAFSRLPERWRTVLWRLEVEGKAPAEVAPAFGLSGNGVSALAVRAREGLRQAYLQEHIGTNIPASCRACAEDLGAGARGRLSPRRQAAMQAHLGHCPACQELFTELSELNRKLGTILAPIALAGTSAALHGGRHVLRAGLAAHWRAMRWHPVTAATGAAASVAVAGGMLFAVNVTPLPAAPSHVTVRAADPAASSGSPAGHRAGDRRGGGGGGAGGGAGGTLTGSGAPAGGIPVGAAGPLPASAPMIGPASLISTAPLAGAGPLAGTVGGAVSGLTGTVNGTVGGLAGTAAVTVTGATSTVVTTVTGITGTVGTTVNGLANNAAATVTGVTSSALATVSGVTGTVAGVTGTTAATISGVTSTVGGTVAGAASTVTATVAGVASTAGTTVTGVADTANSAVTSVASTAASTGSTASGAVTGATTVVGSAVSAGSSTAASTGGTVTAAVTGVVGAALG